MYRDDVAVLEVRDVSKRYQRGDRDITAVDGVSLTLDPGAFAAVVGPSGCGKSTLLHVAGAMDRPTGGEVWLEERLLGTLDDDALTRLRRERIGFVFQFFNLLPTLTVVQNIGLPLLLAGEPVRDVDRRAESWAQEVGLGHRLDHFPQQLSGGEAQRAAIARAVIHRPAVIIADEPTGNLDSANGARVLDLLRTVNRETGAALLLATHDASVAAAAARLVQMRDGHIHES